MVLMTLLYPKGKTTFGLGTIRYICFITSTKDLIKYGATIDLKVHLTHI